MKTLLNNFTTPKQSKRLLELGVPADSADCYCGKDGKLHCIIDGTIPYSLLWETGCIPCWSVGRLIEIILLCHTSNDSGIMFNKSLYELSYCTNIQWCIRVLESRLKCGHMDFSKLEE